MRSPVKAWVLCRHADMKWHFFLYQISEWTLMSISEFFRYRNDCFQSDIFSSDIGITDVGVGCRISPTLRSMSMPIYVQVEHSTRIYVEEEFFVLFFCALLTFFGRRFLRNTRTHTVCMLVFYLSAGLLWPLFIKYPHPAPHIVSSKWKKTDTFCI